jgi:hypothetical protein
MVGDKIGAAAVSAAVGAMGPKDQPSAVRTGVIADKTGSNGKAENGKTGKTRTCNIRCSAAIIHQPPSNLEKPPIFGGFSFFRGGFASARLLDSLASLC